MAANEGSPPGYARALDRGRLIAAFAILSASALVAVAHELLARQTAAYLEPGFGPSHDTVIAVATVAGGAGVVAARTAKLGGRAIPWLTSALSLVASASAALWFFAFGARALFAPLAFALTATGAALCGACAAVIGTALAPKFLAQDGLRFALGPFRLFALALALGSLAGLLSVVGLLRSAAVLGAVLAALALAAAQNALGFGASRGAQRLGLVALGAAALLFAWAERLVPLDDLRAHPAEIVYAYGGERQRHVVVSTRASFQLFSGGVLRATSLDAHRYAESLAHPALALAPRRERVLLLGAADGLVEAEVLRYRDVKQLTVVTADAATSRLAASAPWSPGSVAARDRTRLRVIEAEPIVWLETARERYDVVLVDLPDPIDHREGKNYTLHFYRSLAERLAPGGRAAIQATSPYASPAAFSSIVETLRAASFRLEPYTAPVASFGVWGFVLAEPGGSPRSDAELDPEAVRVLSELRFLDESRLRRALRPAGDELPKASAPLNTLPEQPVVELLHEERSRFGL